MIELKTDEFLSVEKKDLLKRITIYVGKKIEKIKNFKGYKYGEIARKLKVQNARISEWIHCHNYDQNISENDLERCVEEDLVTVDELIKECSKTEKEEKYLKDFRNRRQGGKNCIK